MSGHLFIAASGSRSILAAGTTRAKPYWVRTNNTGRQKMSAQLPTSVFSLTGVSTRALKEAFTRLRAAIRFEEEVEPMWAPEDGCASLIQKEYRLELYFWSAVRNPKDQAFSIRCYGALPDDDLRTIVRVLREPPLPMQK